MTGWLRLESGGYVNADWIERIIPEDGKWLAVTVFNPKTLGLAVGEAERLGILCECCGGALTVKKEISHDE